MSTVADARVYANFAVYKTKGACSIRPISPSFVEVSAGGSNLKLNRVGSMLFEFANAIPSEASPRRYDWENKVTFGLTPVEVGNLLFIFEKNQSASFTHKRDELQKVLKVDPTPNGDGLPSVTTSGSIN